MRKRLFCLIISVITALSLNGCGKTDKLDEYYEAVNTFNEEVGTIAGNMNNLDGEDASQSGALLQELDSLEEQFRVLSEVEVPDVFASNETLADEAYSYMQEAVSGFHEYYENNEADYATFEVAKENYDRAFLRIEYISTILQGEIPEGDNIEVIEEESTDFDPVTADE